MRLCKAQVERLFAVGERVDGESGGKPIAAAAGDRLAHTVDHKSPHRTELSATRRCRSSPHGTQGDVQSPLTNGFQQWTFPVPA